jgi:hypothetical protein
MWRGGMQEMTLFFAALSQEEAGNVSLFRSNGLLSLLLSYHDQEEAERLVDPKGMWRWSE